MRYLDHWFVMVVCPYCNAALQQNCVSRNGKPLSGYTHADRVRWVHALVDLVRSSVGSSNLAAMPLGSHATGREAARIAGSSPARPVAPPRGVVVVYPNEWKPKGLREHLCQQQTFAPDDFTRDEISRLIGVLDLHRPIGPDGKHNDRHTPTCGCEDK